MRTQRSLVRLLTCLVALAAAQLSVAAPGDCSKLKVAKFPNTRITLVEEVAPNPIWIYPPSLFTAMAEGIRSEEHTSELQSPC